jgi:hypothetical protein
MRNHALFAGKRCTRALSWCLASAFALGGPALVRDASAQTVASKAKESGCIDTPRSLEGSMFRCSTASGVSAYFNVPGAENFPSPSRSGSSGRGTPSPAGFPKVDAQTQKGRDDMRRKVLADELAAEEKLLADARITYANGAPVPLGEEQANADKYRERIARLRQSVQLHERNIEALKKELGNMR